MVREHGVPASRPCWQRSLSNALYNIWIYRGASTRLQCSVSIDPYNCWHTRLGRDHFGGRKQTHKNSRRPWELQESPSTRISKQSSLVRVGAVHKYEGFAARDEITESCRVHFISRGSVHVGPMLTQLRERWNGARWIRRIKECFADQIYPKEKEKRRRRWWRTQNQVDALSLWASCNTQWWGKSAITYHALSSKGTSNWTQPECWATTYCELIHLY